MSLDREPVKVNYALRIAKQYYDESTYNHALRVMQFIADNEMIPMEYKEECIALAIMHDLCEDTAYESDELPNNFRVALALLTKPRCMNYIDYIQRIKDSSDASSGKCAWWVKLADMKDHLSQTETLTDRLKEKYLAALPILL